MSATRRFIRAAIHPRAPMTTGVAAVYERGADGVYEVVERARLAEALQARAEAALSGGTPSRWSRACAPWSVGAGELLAAQGFALATHALVLDPHPGRGPQRLHEIRKVWGCSSAAGTALALALEARSGPLRRAPGAPGLPTQFQAARVAAAPVARFAMLHGQPGEAAPWRWAAARSLAALPGPAREHLARALAEAGVPVGPGA